MKRGLVCQTQRWPGCTSLGSTSHLYGLGQTGLMAHLTP